MMVGWEERDSQVIRRRGHRAAPARAGLRVGSARLTVSLSAVSFTKPPPARNPHEGCRGRILGGDTRLASASYRSKCWMG
jgi:hypothetical protein